ncbi:MAG: 6-carboxytetrahydropterin synthase QueD, partial [Syntrophomonadaceae bacterium]
QGDLLNGGLQMFEVTVTQDFAAAHRLYGYQGQCANLHGHTWKVQVSVRSQELNQEGMVVDFKTLKAVLGTILERYDHSLINEIAPFDVESPTAENIAREIFADMKPSLPQAHMLKVKVWESAGSWAAYWEE